MQRLAPMQGAGLQQTAISSVQEPQQVPAWQRLLPQKLPESRVKPSPSKQGPALTPAQGPPAGTEGRTGSAHAALLPPRWVPSQLCRELSHEATGTSAESSRAARRQLRCAFAGKVSTLVRSLVSRPPACTAPLLQAFLSPTRRATTFPLLNTSEGADQAQQYKLGLPQLGYSSHNVHRTRSTQLYLC